MVRRAIRLMLLVMLVVGLLGPANMATAALASNQWACPSASVPGTQVPSGLDPQYMRNLCGLAANAQPASSVKFAEFDGSQSSSTTTKAFLGLPGAFSMDDQYAPLLPVIQAGVNHATFASYAGPRFDITAVVAPIRARLHELLAQYDQVMVFGTSTGGPIASLVIDSSFSAQEKSRITLELGCSPAGKDTLQPMQQLSVSLVWVLGLFSGWNLAWAEEPPARQTFLVLNLLKPNFGSQYQADQGLFLGAYTPLPNGALAGLKRVAYFKAANDQTVNDDAALPKWQAMRGAEPVIVYTEPGEHTDYSGNAADWSRDLTTEIATMAR